MDARHRNVKVASLMPYLRHTSPADSPAACFLKLFDDLLFRKSPLAHVRLP